MKFYLSSYRFGNKTKKLKQMIGAGNRVAYIANALDFAEGQKWQREFLALDVKGFQEMGMQVEPLDLRNYFNLQDSLRKDLERFKAIWVSGGNVFVLRWAMRLSGFEEILLDLHKDREKQMVYGGYSAGICVLSPSLKGLEMVDDPYKKVYARQEGVIWEGLNLLDYAIVPHYDSDHPESSVVGKLADYYQEKGVKHTKLRDGEVILIE